MLWCSQTWITVFFAAWWAFPPLIQLDAVHVPSSRFYSRTGKTSSVNNGTLLIIISSSNVFSNTPAVFRLRLLKQSVLRGWKESCANGSDWLSLTENAFWKEFCQPQKVALYCKFASDSRSRRSDKRASRLLTPRGSIWSVGCLLWNAEIYMSTSSTVQNNRW